MSKDDSAREWSCAERGSRAVRLGRVLAAIDETTLLVPVSLVLFRSSFIVNAKAIVEKAHRVGARVIWMFSKGQGRFLLTCANSASILPLVAF